MSKPLKFHQTLNQPPRSPNGRHRRAGAPAHRSTADRTDHGAGGASPLTVSRQDFSTYTVDEPKPPAIPHAGIRTGEIIGYRLWWLHRNIVDDHCLCSLAHRFLWAPGEVVYGDTNKAVYRGIFGLHPIWGGTYAFARPEFCEPEIIGLASSMETLKEAKRERNLLLLWGTSDYFREAVGFVYGTIKMWGEVVEHQHGYRAEFAKLHSIDRVFSDNDEADLAALRARYLV